MIFVSDTMMAAGLDDGMYELGGQPVTVRGNRATLEGRNPGRIQYQPYGMYENSGPSDENTVGNRSAVRSGESCEIRGNL